MPIITGEIYHAFNRGIESRPTFIDKKERDRAIKIIEFYKYESPQVKLSRFLKMNKELQKEIYGKLEQKKRLVDVLCFCLMPNHFHFLLRQKQDGGISTYISLFLNSYVRYFNTKHERLGPLFLDKFKADTRFSIYSFKSIYVLCN